MDNKKLHQSKVRYISENLEHYQSQLEMAKYSLNEKPRSGDAVYDRLLIEARQKHLDAMEAGLELSRYCKSVVDEMERHGRG